MSRCDNYLGMPENRCVRPSRHKGGCSTEPVVLLGPPRFKPELMTEAIERARKVLAETSENPQPNPVVTHPISEGKS